METTTERLTKLLKKARKVIPGDSNGLGHDIDRTLESVLVIQELDVMIKRLVELTCHDAAHAVRVASDGFRINWK